MRYLALPCFALCALAVPGTFMVCETVMRMLGWFWLEEYLALPAVAIPLLLFAFVIGSLEEEWAQGRLIGLERAMERDALSPPKGKPLGRNPGA